MSFNRAPIAPIPGRRELMACKGAPSLHPPGDASYLPALEELCCQALARRVVQEDDPMTRREMLESLSVYELPMSLRERLISSLARSRLLGSEEFDVIIQSGVAHLSLQDGHLGRGRVGAVFREDGLDGVWGMQDCDMASINLSGCEMHGAIYRMFITAFKLRPPGLQSLIQLDVGGTDISDELLDLIYNTFPCLASLNISRCSFLTGLGSIQEAACAATLTSLDCSFNADSGGGIRAIASLKALTTLSAVQVEWEACSLDDDIGGISTLTSADMIGCAGIAPSHLIGLLSPSMHRLVELSIAEACILPSDLRELTKSIPASASFVLRRLDLSWCEHLDGECIGDLATRCPDLENLQLQSTHLDRESALRIIGACSQLRILNVHRCDSIGGVVVIAAGSLKHLISLDVGWCNISTEAVLNFLENSLSIEVLSLRGCKALDAHLIAAVAAPPLPPPSAGTDESAHVSYRDLETKAPIKNIIAPNLRFIDFNWVNMCSDSLARSLSASRDNLLVTGE